MYTVIQQAIKTKRSLISTYHIEETTGIPKTNEDVQELYDYLYTSDEYGMQVKGILYRNDDRYSATIIQVYVAIPAQNTTSENKKLELLKTELNEDRANYGDATAIVTGNSIVTLSIMNSMTESQLLSTGICFALAAIILSIIYRNPVLGLITMIPITLSIIWVLGTMYFVGYTLNVMTITVTSITIGVGVDYAVYITERFRLVADRTGDATKAVCETVSRTGNAIFIAALSSMCGFGILVFAPIPPQQQFGLITAVTLIYAFLTALLVLPLVLARWANWRKKRKGYIISPGAPKDWDENEDFYEDAHQR
jgi:predicted RND superfamily exporter protein